MHGEALNVHTVYMLVLMTSTPQQQTVNAKNSELVLAPSPPCLVMFYSIQVEGGERTMIERRGQAGKSFQLNVFTQNAALGSLPPPPSYALIIE